MPDYSAGLRRDLKGLRIGVVRHFWEEDLPVSAEVAAALGVAPSYPAPIGRLEAVRGRLETAAQTPGADLLARRLVTLPTHRFVRQRDLDEVVRLLACLSGTGRSAGQE